MTDEEETLKIEKNWNGTTVIKRNIPKEGPMMSFSGGTRSLLEIDVQEEEYPSPKMFHDLGDVASTMISLSLVLPDAYCDEAERIWNDIERLRRMLARERFSDEQQVRDLCYFGIIELPEVERIGTEKIEGEEYEVEKAGGQADD